MVLQQARHTGGELERGREAVRTHPPATEIPIDLWRQSVRHSWQLRTGTFGPRVVLGSADSSRRVSLLFAVMRCAHRFNTGPSQLVSFSMTDVDLVPISSRDRYWRSLRLKIADQRTPTFSVSPCWSCSFRRGTYLSISMGTPSATRMRADTMDNTVRKSTACAGVGHARCGFTWTVCARSTQVKCR